MPSLARKPIVYVSSTFVDLEQHRAALKGALEQAQYDVSKVVVRGSPLQVNSAMGDRQ